ncbi:MAG: potassium transporter TrkG, partial [Myxococcota bacterium]|nr:potassium transporter TrkG [Myxococcota bacterium]
DGLLALCGSGLCISVLGGIGRFVGRHRTEGLRRREALVVVAACWLCAVLLGGLPYLWTGSMSPIDAIFETSSGFTTTGATILVDIEGGLSRPLHLWRVATQWMGGMGIVVLFVAIFPLLGVGGKHMFRSEVPGVPSKALQPRIQETAAVLWRVYLGLTVACVISLALMGLPLFDAFAHAFSTISTAGFSPRSESIGSYDSVPVEVCVTLFMLLSGVNFNLFYLGRNSGLMAAIKNVELRVYLGLWATCTSLIALDLTGSLGSPVEALRAASFQVASILTTTGFTSADYEQWSHFSQAILVLLFFCGGSSGSTSGGMKVIRLIIMSRMVVNEIRRSYNPNLVLTVRVGERAIPSQELTTCTVFALIFMASVALLGLA